MTTKIPISEDHFPLPPPYFPIWNLTYALKIGRGRCDLISSKIICIKNYAGVWEEGLSAKAIWANRKAMPRNSMTTIRKLMGASGMIMTSRSTKIPTKTTVDSINIPVGFRLIGLESKTINGTTNNNGTIENIICR